jgi:hypothetical protein
LAVAAKLTVAANGWACTTKKKAFSIFVINAKREPPTKRAPSKEQTGKGKLNLILSI